MAWRTGPNGPEPRAQSDGTGATGPSCIAKNNVSTCPAIDFISETTDDSLRAVLRRLSWAGRGGRPSKRKLGVSSLYRWIRG